MYGKDQAQFAQFFEEAEGIAHTPSRTSSRVVASTGTPKTKVINTGHESVIMTPRMEIMLKKQQKKLEDEAQLTFQPHVNRSGKKNGTTVSSSGRDSSNRFDALYSDALKRHLETKWKESADTKELTFTPKITERGGRSRATSRTGSRQGSRASSPGPATEATVERLHSTPKGKLKNGVDPDNKLTFKPEITKRAQSIDRKETAKRLYTPNSIDKEKEKDARREMEARSRELENCTFSPQLKTNSSKFAPKENVDLRERMSRFEEMKKAKLQERQQKQLEQELADATFKPTLLSKAKRAPTPTKPFHERLAQPFDRQMPADLEKELSASMTFKPTLVTKRSASPNGRASEYASVHERLFKEGEQRKKEALLAMEALKQEAETNFTFSPEINPTSRAVAADAGPVFERLATSTSKEYMQEVLMKVKTELELKECTFHPKLSTDGYKFVPKEGVPAGPVHERLNQEAELKRQEKERLEQLRIENSLKNHTFAPQIPESSKSMVQTRSFVGSADGSAPGGGSVAGADDIFARLNSQTTIAKSPHLVDPNLTNKSPTRTKSIVLSEGDLAKVYERLASPPKKMSFTERAPGTEDDRSTIGPRKSVHEIDEVINRLHSSHTKAKKADAFVDPQPLHALLRSNSMSNSNNPSPDKSLSRRNSMAGDASVAPAGSPPAPKRMMSMSMTMAPPPSLVRSPSSKVLPRSPSASAAISATSPQASSLQRPASIRTMSPASSTASVKSTTAPAKTKSANGASSSNLPAPPKVVPRKPSQTTVLPPSAPAVAEKPKPTQASAPVSTPTPAPAPAPARTTATASRSSGATGGGGGGGDFLSKIEASMNMLTLNPAQLVAQQQGMAAPAAPVVPAASPAPVPAPAPVPVAAPETTAAPALAVASDDEVPAPETVDADADEEEAAPANDTSNGNDGGEYDDGGNGNDATEEEEEEEDEEEEEEVVNVEHEY